MAKKQQREGEKGGSVELGQYLAGIRGVKRMTLREVEEATGRDVSNAYLSQLEHGKISKPSPNVLYSLAEVYGVSYETLMEKVGYITSTPERKKTAKHGRAATSALSDLSAEEEEELLQYLAYLRSKKKL